MYSTQFSNSHKRNVLRSRCGFLCRWEAWHMVHPVCPPLLFCAGCQRNCSRDDLCYCRSCRDGEGRLTGAAGAAGAAAVSDDCGEAFRGGSRVSVSQVQVEVLQGRRIFLSLPAVRSAFQIHFHVFKISFVFCTHGPVGWMKQFWSKTFREGGHVLRQQCFRSG